MGWGLKKAVLGVTYVLNVPLGEGAGKIFVVVQGAEPLGGLENLRGTETPSETMTYHSTLTHSKSSKYKLHLQNICRNGYTSRGMRTRCNPL